MSLKAADSNDSVMLVFFFLAKTISTFVGSKFCLIDCYANHVLYI